MSSFKNPPGQKYSTSLININTLPETKKLTSEPTIQISSDLETAEWDQLMQD